MYAVIDTNVIVASLKTRHHDSATARVMDAVYSGQVKPLVNDEILAEYKEVLNRPRLKLDSVKCNYLVALIADLAERLSPVSSGATMLDEDDRIFFEIALAGQKIADTRLVTGNAKHYPPADFVVSPAE
ncbi:MAG: putative toxin-antitoxin system toxin component, PIN family, partial [Kiritimatiellia bacterium]